MGLPDLAEIERKVRELAALIGATGYLLPTFGRSEDGARPHIEADAAALHYVVVERGKELEHVTTCDIDELLWHVFQSVTFDLASDFAVKHRVEGRDFRRTLFSKQLELLAALSPEWARREALYQKGVLYRNPYDDTTDARP